VTNKELLIEMKEEEMVKAILMMQKLPRMSFRKINHHGKRADAIVKGVATQP
jgi:metal-dependent HD superfamily phosphatase/phosphodiesterase